MKHHRSGTPSMRAEAALNPGPGSIVLRASLLTLLLLAPGSAAAQDTGGRAARAELEGAFGATAIRGEGAPFAGGGGLLDFGLPVRFGGAGWILLTSRSVPGGSDHYDLRVAYGGVLLDAPIGSHGRAAFSLRTLLGVGNAKVTLPVVGTLIGADNFGVVEPQVHGTIRLTRAVGLTIQGGYRTVFGVEDLPGVGPEDLRGPSMRLGVVFGNLQTSNE